MKFKSIVLFLLISILNQPLFSAEFPLKQKTDEPVFRMVDSITTTPVANQYKTNTCWSFSTISFLESELIRKTGTYYNFSEMYVIRKAYVEKAERYIRMQGHINFAGGGEPNDVLDVFKKSGFMPESSYTGLVKEQINHNHLAMDESLKNFVSDIVKNPAEKLNENWLNEFNKKIDGFIGELPLTFVYNEKEYTPASFAGTIDLNYDDYILLTSLSHHPYYSKFILEVPDNWSWGEVYNVPLNELTEILEFALSKGYSATWSADISEKGFSFSNGIAVVPEVLYDTETGNSRKKIEKLSPEDFSEKYLKNIPSIKELSVTPVIRQKAFDNLSTTDDHGMHITGKAVDPNGKTFYYVKNSWGTNNLYHGYQFVSKPYFEFKTISIMLHKDAIPAEIKEKLKID